MKPTVSERFWAKVEKTPTCWLWDGALAGPGRCYGRFYDRGNIPAHRWAYEQARGPIPDGLVLDHVCRQTRCVNPDHLEPVTNRTNVLRGIGPSAINARKIHCKRGHLLTPENTCKTSRSPLARGACRQCMAETKAKLNAERRAAGLCIACRQPSIRWKCKSCQKKQLAVDSRRRRRLRLAS